jgi:hypothetical protein
MADRHSEDEAFSTDMQLIEELAAGLRLRHWPGDSDTIVELGGLEDTSILAARNGVFSYETTSRGQRSIQAAFSSARDARRCLVMELCDSYRFANRMPSLVMRQLAAGSQLEDGPTGHRLTWPGGEATFHDRSRAVTFSWAIGAGPDTILASYQHVNGEPLFDLGIPVDEWNLHTARRRPAGRVMEPTIETPPPDDENAADRAAIDTVLADLRWQRRTPSGADVLAVGDARMGRAIAYRQSQFVYESTTPTRYRTTRCTFSTAAAARRFMLMELGHVFRLRTGMPRIQPNRLARHCTIEEGPTGVELTWSEGRGHVPDRLQRADGRANLQLGRHGRARRDHCKLPPPKRRAPLSPGSPRLTPSRRL